MSVNRKISNLPAVVGASILDADILPLVASGVTSKTTIADLRIKLGTNPPAGGRTVTDAATYLLNNAVFNVKDFGAFGDGSHNDTTAVQLAYSTANAYAVANGGAKVVWPMGTYIITDTIVVNTHRVHTEGHERWATNIAFNPATAKPLFKVQTTNTALVIYQGSFKKMTLTGAGTQQKIAFDLWDSSEWLIEDIAVASSWTGNSASSSTPSIGLRTNGREVLTVRRFTVFADRPIHIRQNPNAPAQAENTDHFHFTDLYFSVQIASETGILIDANAPVSNLTFDGYQAWVGGKYGLDFVAGGATGVTSFQAAFNNVRYEQSADATGYAFRWQPENCQNLLLNNCYFGTVSNGTFIRNTRRVEYNSCQYPGTGGKIAADWDNTSDEIILINTFFNDGSILNIGTLVEVFGVGQRNSASPNSVFSYYANPSTVRKAIRVNGNYYRTYAQSVAAAGSFTMPDFNPGTSQKIARVRVSGYSTVGPIIEGGDLMDGPAVAALISGTANFAATNVAGKLCFLHGGNPTILNNTAQTLNVLVTVEWMP